MTFHKYANNVYSHGNLSSEFVPSCVSGWHSCPIISIYSSSCESFFGTVPGAFIQTSLDIDNSQF